MLMITNNEHNISYIYDDDDDDDDYFIQTN